MNHVVQRFNWLYRQTRPRQISIVIGFTLIALVTTGLSVWLMLPGYGVLFNHLDSRDTNQILSQLEQADIRYQVQNHGSEILIDKRLIEKTRMQLMASKRALSHSVGFELFDKTDFGMTDFSQKINYQRALQGELERTIASLDEVQDARVHLVIPEHHLFQSETDLPRVAVTLHLYQPLTTPQIKSIQRLMTASVAHLPAKNVVIVDQNGNALTHDEEDSTTNQQFAAKKSVEQYLNDKVMHMLHTIFSNEPVMVKIDATLNYDQLQRELVKPQHDGFITHEKETQHAIVNKAEKNGTNRDFTREKSYQFGREKEQFTRANGTIERLTISVVLPASVSQEKIQQVEHLVKAIVGFDGKRGDVISIEALTSKPAHSQLHRIKPTQAPAPNHIALPTKQTLYGLSASLLLLLFFSLWLRLRQRQQRRQQLLADLNQWLLEHD